MLERSRFRWLAAAAALLSASVGRAAGPMQFLLLDSNARARALGGAYTALADGADAVHHNAGALAFNRRIQASFMHDQGFQGITRQYAGLAWKTGWGVSLNRLDFGSVERTTVFNPEGTGESVLYESLALSGGYAHRLGGGVAAGAALKGIRESIEDDSAHGFAADLGALYRPPEAPGLSIGLALRNLGPALSRDGGPEALPTELRLGVAYRRAAGAVPVTPALDLARERGEKLAVNAGLEAEIRESLSVRAGYDSRNEASSVPSFGLGLRGRRLGFDYALAPFGDLGTAHRVSVSAAWD